ncbi:hypothetical protein PMAYCL1PPCAC_20274, partial [Pristionchus mayeri]
VFNLNKINHDALGKYGTDSCQTVRKYLPTHSTTASRTHLVVFLPLWNRLRDFSLDGRKALLTIISDIYFLVERTNVEIEFSEIVGFNLGTPVLVGIAVTTSVYYPPVSLAFTSLLIATAIPHLRLLLHSRRKFHHSFLLFCSSIMLLASIVAMDLVCELGIQVIVPTITSAIYAEFVVMISIYEMRQKVSFLSYLNFITGKC